MSFALLYIGGTQLRQKSRKRLLQCLCVCTRVLSYKCNQIEHNQYVTVTTARAAETKHN